MFYINVDKRKIVNSVNFVLDKKLSFDYESIFELDFTFLDKNGKILTLNADDDFYIVGNDKLNSDKPIFYSNDFSIDGNAINFTIDTYTENYFEKVKNRDTKIYVEIGRKLIESNYCKILYQDDAIAQPRIKTDVTPIPLVISRTFVPSDATVFNEVDATTYYISAYKQKSLLDVANKSTDNAIVLNYEEIDYLKFKILDKQGKIVPLLATDKAYIAVSTSYDNIIAYSDIYMIADDTLTFKLDTCTQQFLTSIVQPSQSILIEVGYKHFDDESFKVIYQGENIAFPRIFSTLNPPDVRLTKYYTADEVDDLIEAIEVNIDPENYYNKTEVDDLLEDVEVDLSDYYNKTEVDGLIENVQVDLSDYYNKSESDERFALSTYSPRMIYTYVHPTFGRCVYLDSITTSTKMLDKVVNLHKITLQVLSITNLFSGDVKLDFYIDDVFIKSQVFASGSTANIIFDTPITGNLKITRDTTSASDTLKDGLSVIACIIPVVRISEG